MRGIIRNVRDGFAFAWAPELQGDVFCHAKDFLNRAEAALIQAGSEVEFRNIIQDREGLPRALGIKITRV